MVRSRVSIPARRYAAYIFDLDGTLVDSMCAHYKAWHRALLLSGAPDHVFTWNEFLAHGGRSAQDVVSSLNQKHSLQLDTAAVSSLKRQCYLDLIAHEKLSAIGETISFVLHLKRSGIPYGIGTGSLAKGARATLAAAGIENLFDIIITPEDVLHGKPAPDIFLKVAEILGAPPDNCLVFEDAEPGLEAAAAAGMDSVQVLPPAKPF